jgi:hypothetical protein
MVLEHPRVHKSPFHEPNHILKNSNCAKLPKGTWDHLNIWCIFIEFKIINQIQNLTSNF